MDNENYTIIFVDDEEAILSSLRSLLRKNHYKAQFFSSGKDALEFLKEHPAEIIVSDMRMPTMSGQEFLQASANISPESYRIILSGYEDKNIIISALDKGLAQQYILKPWDDNEFKEVISSSVNKLIQIRKNHLENILRKVLDLPSSPKINTHLIQLLQSDKLNLHEIISAIEQNPPLFAKILRVANSVFVGSRNTITTIREAISFIGIEYIISLIISSDAYSMLSINQNPANTTLIESIWTESQQRAGIAKFIAEHTPNFKDTSLLYIATMLQDIGFIVRCSYCPEEFQRYMRVTNTNVFDEYEIEKNIFTITHDQVSATLLEYWNFPPSIVSAVSQHHSIKIDHDIFLSIVQQATVLASPKMFIRHDLNLDESIIHWKNKLQLISLKDITSEHV